MPIFNLALTRGMPGWCVHLFKLSPRLPWGPPACGHTSASRAAALGERWLLIMLIDIYLKVEEEVVFCGGAVGKSGEVSTKSSIEDLLSKNLVQEYKQGYETKKMWMGGL